MTLTQIIGFVLFALGLVFLVLGINAAQSFGEEVRSELSGNYSDRTIGYIVGGSAGVVVGGALLVLGFVRGRRPPR